MNWQQKWYVKNREKVLRKRKVYAKKNKEKLKQKRQENYKNNKTKIMKINSKWAKANPKKVKEIQKRCIQKIRKTRPWTLFWWYARRRCNNHKNKLYYGRGIKCFLTLVEIENLWKRDRAYLLKNPSLDRKHPDKHYTFDNCRFIELINNQKNEILRNSSGHFISRPHL